MNDIYNNGAKNAALIEIDRQLKNSDYGYTFFLTGRAATALLYTYLSIKKLKPNVENPEIILPALSCSTPSNTALICGLTPRYADISEENGLTNLEEIKKRYTRCTVAVLFIHLFGNTADLGELKKWCELKGIYLIEDVAQSLGGTFPNGNICGSIGDFSVYSFNKTKIIECGGGALAVKTKSLSDLTAEVIARTSFPECHNYEYISQLSTSYRNLHHSLVSLKRANPDADISPGFLQIRRNYEPLSYRTLINAEALANDLKSLKKRLASRYTKAGVYLDNISKNKSFSFLNGWEKSGCCWRFSFLISVPEELVTFSEAIRKDGFHVSNLYWPVNQFFNPSDVCPKADKTGRNIINLWVDDSVSEDSIKSCCSSIMKNTKIK